MNMIFDLSHTEQSSILSSQPHLQREEFQFVITIWNSDTSNINKEYDLDGNGTIQKSSSAHMSSGKFEVKYIKTAESLLDVFNRLASNQAVSIGIPHDLDSNLPILKGSVCSEKKHVKGSINRTKQYMQFSNCFIFDIDDTNLSIDEILPALLNVDSNLLQANILVRPSSSCGIRKSADKASVKHGSYHVWVGGVDTPSDIARYGNVFSERCWLQGTGKICISKAGSFLVRQLIDASVFSPERLVFEAKPTLGKGIEQDEIPFRIHKGIGIGLFDTKLLKDLNENELASKQLLVNQYKDRLRPEAQEIKLSYIDKHVSDATHNGDDPELIRQHLTASLISSELYSSQYVKFDHEGIVKVEDILKSPERYDQCSLADPYDWKIDVQTNVAKFYANKGKPLIHSFKHGGYTLLLKQDIQTLDSVEKINRFVTSAINNNELTNTNYTAWIAETIITFGIESEYEDEIINIVLGSLNLGKQKTDLKKRVKNMKRKITQQNNSKIDKNVLPIQTDLTQKLGIQYFSDIKYQRDQAIPLPTESNLKALFRGYGITARYDLNSKEQTIIFKNGDNFCADMQPIARLARINSLCNLNELPAGVMNLLSTQFAENSVTPVVNYISKIKWDGNDHIAALLKLVHVSSESQQLWEIALPRWLIQCVAAADYAQQTRNSQAVAKFEYCLVLVGKQGIAKTSFFNNLIPDPLKNYFSDGISLNVNDKDSIKQAVSNWISELGEIESSMTKSNNAIFKAFLSKRIDEIRLPYDRTFSQLQRRVSFCGSVNDPNFLSDSTGSRRFWPIDIISLPQHLQTHIDIDQLWANVWNRYINGDQWWDDENMVELVQNASKSHSTVKVIRDLLMSEFDLDATHKSGTFFSIKNIRELLDMPATDATFRDLHSVLQNEFNKPKITLNGYEGYRLAPHG